MVAFNSPLLQPSRYSSERNDRPIFSLSQILCSRKMIDTHGLPRIYDSIPPFLQLRLASNCHCPVTFCFYASFTPTCHPSSATAAIFMTLICDPDSQVSVSRSIERADLGWMDGWWGRWKYAWTHPSAWLSFLWTGWIDWWNGRNEFLWMILTFSTGRSGDFSLVCLHDGRAYRRMEESGSMAVPHFAVYSYFPYHDEWIWAGVFSPYRLH